MTPPSNAPNQLQPIDPALYPRRGDATDPRIADVIDAAPGALERLSRGDIALIGFPQDEGVRRNKGRIGAAAAPGEIRTHLGRIIAPRDFDPAQTAPPLTRTIRDLGDIPCDSDLEASQERLGETVAAVFAAGALPITLGGGHETAYGHFLGYANTARPTGIINIDTHLDVRPLRDNKGHSGSPFREAIEHPSRTLVPGGYLCIGVQPHAVAAAHLDYMRTRGQTWSLLSDIHAYFATPQASRPPEFSVFPKFRQNLAKQNAAGLMLSIDLDAVRQSDAPGVSAPSPTGLTAEQLLALVQQLLAGGVTSIDIVELCPHFDRDGQSARLAALVVWTAISFAPRSAAGRGG